MKYKNKDYTEVVNQINEYINNWGFYPAKREIEKMGIQTRQELYRVFYVKHPEMLELKKQKIQTDKCKVLKEFSKVFEKKPINLKQISKEYPEVYYLLIKFYKDEDDSLINCFIRDYIPNAKTSREHRRDVKIKSIMKKLTQDNILYLYIGHGTDNQKNLTRQLRYYVQKRLNSSYLNIEDFKQAIKDEFDIDAKLAH